MPQEQPQLDSGYDYVKLPDGSYVKFNKGTSPEEMRGRLMAAGKLPPSPYKGPVTPAKPDVQLPKAYGFTPKNVAKNTWEGAKSVVKGTYDLGATLVGKPDPTKQGGNVEQTLQKVFQPMQEQWQKAQDAYKHNRLSEAIGHAGAGSIPFFGPMAGQLGEQAGRGDIGGAVGQAAGMALVGKGSDLVLDKATGFTDPAALRDRAAALDTKVLKTAQAGAKGYKLSTALQVAKEGIYGTLKSLPDKIETKRMAKNVQVQQIARQLDAQGTTINVDADIAPITRDVMSVANQRGMLTPQLRTQIMGLLKRVTTQTDMQTGATVPRNLTQMKVSEALQLQKGLEDLSAFGKDVPKPIENLARRLRGALGDKIAGASPEMQRLRGEESSLISARNAARKNYADALNSGRAGARGFIYSSLPTAGVYVGLKALGLPFAGAIGTALVLRTLAESTPSRTFRAAMYAKAADMLDGAITRNTGQQGPPQGGTALTPTSPQTGPQTGPNARLAGAPQDGPQAPPTAPANVVSTNPATNVDTVAPPTVQTRGTALPEKATRARAGSGDYAKADLDKLNAMRASAKPQRQVKPEMSPSEQAAWQQSAFGEKPVEDVGGKVRAQQKAVPRSGAESNTKTKAMMDRLDTLFERRDNPKSGADRNAIEREIGEIKRVLAGEVTGSDASAINKRIADRERLATKRATAKSATPGTQTNAPTGSTAEPATRPSASPENRAMLLDMGYKKLASYDGGPEMVGAMRKMAKEMQKVDPSYDEVTALTDALNALKEVSGGH